jgi:GDP/UDP-N,N'-diacetylbacillosamine 2-epimerase (hydrolysing)
MNIVILSSTRADYSIYLPLLKKMKKDSYFTIKIVAFGTHLSEQYGKTVDNFKKDGFEVYAQIDSLPEGDTPQAIAKAMGKTISNFARFWEVEKKSTDLIFAIGDRYEMFAAVTASVPFTIPIAHFHGGETTLGAIDNVFRHSLTLMAGYHFVSTQHNAKRVAEILGDTNHIYPVGALSLDNLREIHLLSIEEFFAEFGIDMSSPTILVTFHPETIQYDKNEYYAHEIIKVLKKIPSQVIITMPNADTMGNAIRKIFTDFALTQPAVHTVESLGTLGYFSCIKHCSFLLGNSSSGIIEAASFGKYVLNIGDRQKGRETGDNVLHCPIDEKLILEKIDTIKNLKLPSTYNIYGDGKAADKIIEILKTKI